MLCARSAPEQNSLCVGKCAKFCRPGGKRAKSRSGSQRAKFPSRADPYSTTVPTHDVSGLASAVSVESVHRERSGLDSLYLANATKSENQINAAWLVLLRARETRQSTVTRTNFGDLEIRCGVAMPKWPMRCGPVSGVGGLGAGVDGWSPPPPPHGARRHGQFLSPHPPP